MKFLSPGLVLFACTASLLFLPITLVSQQSVSHVRVVRLSYLSGSVAIKASDATKWVKAMVDTPVQEGFEISTSADSYAEVEFENGSTARLGQLSRLTFDQLALDPEGHKLNRMTFEQGCATFHFLPEKHDAYSVKIAGATLTTSGKSRFRTDLSKGHARVEVFNGLVEVAGPSGSAKLGKDKVLEYNTGTTEVAFNTRQGIAKDAWDKWTEARDSHLMALKRREVAPNAMAHAWNGDTWSTRDGSPMPSTTRSSGSSIAFPRP